MTKTIVSSLMILGVLLIRKVFQKKVSPVFMYSLWLFVAVRLLMPGMLLPGPISVMNTDLWRMGRKVLAEEESRQEEVYKRQQFQEYTQKAQKAYQENQAREELGTEIPSGGEAGWEQEGEKQAPREDAGEKITSYSYELKWHWAGTFFGRLRQLSEILWLAGMTLLFLLFLWRNLFFYRFLRSERKRLKDERTDFGKLRVYAVGNDLPSPCLFGLVPAIYIPKRDLDAGAQHQELILAHELTHYRHGDPIWALVRALCLIINWYNPLVWLAARISQQDGELACDAGCVHRLGEEKRWAYGEALLAMVRVSGEKGKILETATMMTSGKKFMKKRIDYIAGKRKRSICATAAVVILIFLCVGCTYTGTTYREEKGDEQVSSSTETSTRGENKGDPAEEREESEEAAFEGTVVVLKGEGKELNGNLQGMVFLFLPDPQGNGKSVVMLSDDLYMPDLSGKGAKLERLCIDCTSQEMLALLNRNLALNLKEIEVWDYETLMEMVDEGGGMQADVKEDEVAHLNAYQIMMTGKGDLSEDEVTNSGEQLLNGIQTAAYLQIRYNPRGSVKDMERWKGAAECIWQKEEITGCYTDWFAGADETIYVEGGEPESYLLSLCWEQKIKELHETFYPHIAYRTTEEVREADWAMKEQAKLDVDLKRREASGTSRLFFQYMGRNTFLISLLSDVMPDRVMTDVWESAEVYLSGRELVIDEEKGKAVFLANLVFEESTAVNLPERSPEEEVMIERFLYLTKREDGWHVDGLLHNDLPPAEWWEGERLQWEIYHYGYSDEDSVGKVCVSQEEYLALVKEAEEAAKKRERLIDAFP